MRKTLLGLIVGLLIGTAGTALAANNFIQAEFAKFNLEVNGEKQELKNEPLVVNGTTYWPLRELSEYTGLEVDYIEETRTIVINTPIKEDDEVGDPEIERLELDGPFNVDAYNTLSEIDDRIDYLKGLLDRYIRDDMPFNQSRARAEISMLERKRANIENESNTVPVAEDPYGTIESINQRLNYLESDLIQTNATLWGYNDMIRINREHPTDGSEQNILNSQAQIKIYEAKKLEIVTEIAELEAKLQKLQ